MTDRRAITRADIIDIDDYARNRREHKKRVADIKRPRRVEVGPFATFYFENYDTMWHQVHEMLHIERGGETQITDELDAYNPLIPQGEELVATVMFEIDDPNRRDTVLGQLGGIEDRMYLSVGAARSARPIPPAKTPAPRARPRRCSACASASPAQIAKFRDPATQVLVGIDHPRYGHIAVMSDAVRAALAQQFA